MEAEIIVQSSIKVVQDQGIFAAFAGPESISLNF